MHDEPTSIGTRFIASIGSHEAIVELREDGWHKGIYDDDARAWEVPPSHAGSARAGKDYCENHLQGLAGSALRLTWRQVGGNNSTNGSD